jgi:hemoglobin
MPSDIETRADIDLLMEKFYARAMSDAQIGYLFTDVAQLDLQHHLPVIGDFWESTLFGSGSYARHKRHPLLIHAELDRKSPLLAEHFGRWLEIFTATIDETFAGTHADFLKQRGHAIARRMQEFVSASRQ